MDMDSAAAFLAGSILYAVGFIVILIAIVIANNIIYKYWKSFGWSFVPNWFNEHNARFMTPEEAARVAPTFDTNTKEKK
jgi:cytochrome b561